MAGLGPERRMRPRPGDFKSARSALPLPQARMELAGTLPVKNASPMNFHRFRLLAALSLFAPALVVAQPAGAGLPTGVAWVTSVEVVTEYRPPNGLNILRFPTRSTETRPG